jgi:hypothetical protein
LTPKSDILLSESFEIDGAAMYKQACVSKWDDLYLGRRKATI